MNPKKESVKIERIIVKNLFKKYNYDIDLNNGYDISVLIGPNGCGKTTIFTILDLIFNPSLEGYTKLLTGNPYHPYVFDKFECVLSNGKILKLFTEEIDNKNNVYPNEFRLFFKIDENKNNAIKTDTERVILFNSLACLSFEYFSKHREVYFLQEKFNLQVRNIIRKYEKELIDIDEYSSLYCKKEMILDGLNNYLSNESEKTKQNFNELKEFYADFFKKDEIRCQPLIKFISANRLYNLKDGKEVVDEIGHEIQNQMSEILRECEMLIINASDKFLKFLIDDFASYKKIYEEKICPQKDEYIKKWTDYFELIKKYNSVDILNFSDYKHEQQYEDVPLFRSFPLGHLSYLSSLNHESIKDIYDNDPCKSVIYSKYINAFGELGGYSLKEFYTKLKMFFDILKERNYINVDDFKSENSPNCFKGIFDDIEFLSQMSSGEKNDFILFYNLIFSDNTVILIDEPEISLNIEWQEIFIDYLLKICKMKEKELNENMQVIIATHSPHILNGHEELLIDGALIDER